MAKVDVYREWLKIEATNRPLTYYQVLKLKQFEDDVNVIRNHYRQVNNHVRKFATGEFIEESQALLNELAKAMLCLTDATRKSEYDFSLGRTTPESESTGRRSFEDILLNNRVLSPEQLKKAERYAEAIGLNLEMAILQQKMAEPEKVMIAYAESQGLPFVNLDEVPVDEYYAPQIDPVLARQHSFIPVMADMGRMILASPTPLDLDVETILSAHFEMPIRSAICLPTQINAAIAKYYPRDAVQVVVAKGAATKETPAKGKGTQDSGTTASTPVKKVKKANATRRQLSAEEKGNRFKLTAVVFNFTFMAVVFGLYFYRPNQPITKFILPGVIAGAIGAAIAWFVASRPKEDEE